MAEHHPLNNGTLTAPAVGRRQVSPAAPRGLSQRTKVQERAVARWLMFRLRLRACPHRRRDRVRRNQATSAPGDRRRQVPRALQSGSADPDPVAPCSSPQAGHWSGRIQGNWRGHGVALPSLPSAQIRVLVRSVPARDELRAAVLRAAGVCYGVEPSASVVESDILGSGAIEQRAFVECLRPGESPRSVARRSSAAKTPGTRVGEAVAPRCT